MLAGAALLGYAWKSNSKRLGLASAGLLAARRDRLLPGLCRWASITPTPGRRSAGSAAFTFAKSITINAPPEAVYRFWRQLDRLPEVMPHLEKVEQLDTKRSRWTAKAFDRVPITWEAEIINEVPFETIGWKTLPGEAVQNAGSVTFKPAPGDGGTEVRVHLQYCRARR